jgi:hypothetical protein
MTWGIISIIPLCLFCSNTEVVEDYSFLKAYTFCDLENNSPIITYQEEFEFPDTTLRFDINSSKTPPIDAFMDSSRIILSSFGKSDSALVCIIENSGKSFSSFFLDDWPQSPQIIDDTTILFTLGKYSRHAILTDRQGKIKRELFLPLDQRPIGTHQIITNKFFRAGFEDKKTYAKGDFNWALGIYDLNNLLPIDKAGSYSEELILHYYTEIKIHATSPVHFTEKNGLICGVFSYFPVIFAFNPETKQENHWRVPFKEFHIPDNSAFVFPGKEKELKRHLESVSWSLQYRMIDLDDSLAYVFRGVHTPWFIDVYDFSDSTPVWLGSVQTEDDLQPIAGYRNKILFLNKSKYLNNKLSFRYGIITLE